MIEVMNLFFVPMISIYIYYVRKGERPALNLSFAVRYCAFTALVFLGAKLLSQVVNVFYPIDIPLYNAYYTVFAVPAAALLPLLMEFFRKYFGLRMEAEEKRDEKEAA